MLNNSDKVNTKMVSLKVLVPPPDAFVVGVGVTVEVEPVGMGITVLLLLLEEGWSVKHVLCRI